MAVSDTNILHSPPPPNLYVCTHVPCSDAHIFSLQQRHFVTGSNTSKETIESVCVCVGMFVGACAGATSKHAQC